MQKHEVKIKYQGIALTFALCIASWALNASAAGKAGILTGDPDTHFDPKGNPPSHFTIEVQKKVRETLPFNDKRDFEEAQKGFIAAPPYKTIMAKGGNVAWDMASYEWLLQDKQFDSINPSLQRQATLNTGYGLYEVVPDKIYQIRGFDLANMTFIKGNTGWIILDTLTTTETARAALEFVNQHLGYRPIVAVIYSHPHADHYGGVRGILDEADVKSGRIPIIAPAGFLEHAVSENVYAGNAMARRLFFQYGILLPRSPYGHVDQAIGKNTAVGNISLLPPTYSIAKDYETLVIDGVEMEFQSTPGTEAPVEMNTYFPQYKAFWAAENVSSTIHNIYTLRGAQVRDSLAWSKHINNALYRYGQDAEVMFTAHSWPRWGNKRIQEVLRTQRDTYANLNNQVLHLANQGVTINEIHNVYTLPNSLKQQWAAHSYHGSEEHNSRAIINRYLGYWDANPATLTPLSPQDSAPLYVEMMGGSQKILEKGKQLYDEGKYLLAMEILNKLVYAQPDNTEAKDLLADTFEQIGYQKESTSLRNSFLSAAYELRNGYPEGASPKGTGADTLKAMTTEMLLDYLAVLIDSRQIEGKSFTVNLVIPDTEEQFTIEISNATMTNIKGFLSSYPDLTLHINRSAIEGALGQAVPLGRFIRENASVLKGNTEILTIIEAAITSFTPDFEMVPGTQRKSR